MIAVGVEDASQSVFDVDDHGVDPAVVRKILGMFAASDIRLCCLPAFDMAWKQNSHLMVPGHPQPYLCNRYSISCLMNE